MDTHGGLRRMRVVIVAATFLCAACTTTSFTPAPKAGSYSPNPGKVIVLAALIDPGTAHEGVKEIAEGAEEIGTIRVETTSPWMSRADFVERWKKEAALHGANAVKWCGSGCRKAAWPNYYRSATAYRVPNINDADIKTAPPTAQYHD